MEDYKKKIIDFIEGNIDAKVFCAWFESETQVLDWLQSQIPSGKTMRECVEEPIDYFLKNLEPEAQEKIYKAYHILCHEIEVDGDEQVSCAKKLVDQLCALDQDIVRFTEFQKLLLYNYKSVFDNPNKYKLGVQKMPMLVKEFMERTENTIQDVPYSAKAFYERCKKSSSIWVQVEMQSWLYHSMIELYPDETICKDESLYQKALFISDVCPEYIEGHEVEEAGIIEKIVEQVPESLSKTERKKQIKGLIKKEFHLEGKYPRWIQGGEWPVSKTGKPMRFVKQKRKKGIEYETMLYTQFFFEDVETGEERVIEQFT